MHICQSCRNLDRTGNKLLLTNSDVEDLETREGLCPARKVHNNQRDKFGALQVVRQEHAAQDCGPEDCRGGIVEEEIAVGNGG